MGRALGSNRAEYSRKRELATNINLTRSMMGLPLLDIKNLNLDEIKKLWHEIYTEAKKIGIIK